MKFSSRDPDIETIVRRINEGDYDLQPDFQRGDVWTPLKQKRLIDSVLREWHIPPVHLVSRDDEHSDVLDGQQRLTAIRDFMAGKFAIDGTLEPDDPRVAELHGLRYGELPTEVQKRFRRFTIRIFELTDYGPSEPHELFFRLNQPTNLTEAEKRNAFVGAPRNQVKSLVKYAEAAGLDSAILGFTNARMAHDDVFARYLITLENRSLSAKVTSARVTARYRLDLPFDDSLMSTTQTSIDALAGLRDVVDARGLRFNKATIHSWLLLLSQIQQLGEHALFASTLEIIPFIEEHRWGRSRRAEDTFTSELLAIFQDRSTARVADVSSVILRDFISFMLLWKIDPRVGGEPQWAVVGEAWHLLQSGPRLEDDLLRLAVESNWGEMSGAHS